MLVSKKKHSKFPVLSRDKICIIYPLCELSKGNVRDPFQYVHNIVISLKLIEREFVNILMISCLKLE